MSSEPRPSELSLVFAGGGAVGIAWHLAVVEGLRSFGFDVDAAPALGTSAGSWACAALRLGIGFDEFATIGDINVPDRRPDALAGIARSLMGDGHVDNVTISTVELRRMRRHLHDGSSHPIADLVAASSAVPGLFSPHHLDGVAHVDGGVRSMASADLASPAALLVASLPIAGPLFGPVGRIMESTSRSALARWRRRTGGDTLVLRPGRTFASAVGFRPNAMFDVTLACRLYPIGYDTVCRRLDSRLSARALLVA